MVGSSACILIVVDVLPSAVRPCPLPPLSMSQVMITLTDSQNLPSPSAFTKIHQVKLRRLNDQDFCRRQDHLVTQVLSAGFLRYLGLSVKGFDSGLRPGIAGGRLWVPVLRAVACLPHSLGCPSLGSATAGIDSTAGPAFTAGMTSAAGVVFTAINLASGIGLAAGIASTATIVFTAGLALAAPGSTECVHPGWLIQFLHCIGPDRSPEL
ncbi:uncharacterized protein MYCGRDRAFT_106745 [Zymoseptoria tritici IPO323]|uniref:Uncharacterized protein n=1 Tax=Zymoseptoria tritici (strain CBS 115943 / IPO323) TaxID=336722 RepID=F9WZF8_ZYMTI|nr:uncharacterized protein MYCGRDRAFT_106745 [Zymoseptoria tritici IPO323]EGP90826.1 hypothetical protein MYCGRDRAFT_106745 [Zymoseptoria tritici IPO323]